MADTIYFETFEAREEAFRQSVFALIPRKYSGPRLFWKDFSRTGKVLEGGEVAAPIAYITANPRDCLVYGTPLQILAAAHLCAQGAGNLNAPPVEDVVRRFGLEAHLDQPVRTLSGGETVKVALAKAFVAAFYCRRLTIASPFTWLSQANRMYFEDLAAFYQRQVVPLQVLALSGEDSIAPFSAAEFPGGPVAETLDFRLRFEDFKILLTTSVNPLYQADLHARVENFGARLTSPCLMIGENGQGKSLIAKALVGALTCEGEGQVQADSTSGPARLLFQDVVSQTLLRNFDGIIAAAGGDQARQIGEVYSEISAATHAHAAASVAGPPERSKRRNAFHSLLEMKTVLTAVRLCGRPRALILDEPDWGLSRLTAAAFVNGVIKAAHQRGIPVILISHKPWWLPAAGSVLRVERIPGEPAGSDGCAFTIRISVERAHRNRITP